MADDRRGPLVIGALTAITGAVLFLAAGDVIPLPDQTFGGPRWLVALFALGFFFGGGYALGLAPDVSSVIVRAFFWIFAIPVDALALVAWFIALRWLVRRPPP
jgi:hypothetical protein